MDKKALATQRLVRDREDSRKFDQGNYSDFVFKIVGGGVTQASQWKFGKIKLSIFIVN